VDEGELSPDLDIDAAVAELLGSMMYRNLLRLMGGHPPDNLAEVIVATLWRAYGRARGRPVRAKRSVGADPRSRQ